MSVVGVSNLVTKEGILLQLQAATPAAIREEMVDALISRSMLPSDLREVVLTGLKEREEKMTTAIGNSLSLPHAAVGELSSVVTMIALAKQGVDCDALDQKPVHVFFMILVPNDQYSLHLRTLALVAKFFTRPNITERLLAAKSVDEIYNLFQE